MFRLNRRTLLGVLAAATLVGPAAAETYPSKPITLVAPFPAGGTGDLVARALGQALSSRLGQPIVVDNRPGASGSVGTAAALRAPADGYTLVSGSTPDQVIGPFLRPDFPYDPATDFELVDFIVRYPNVLVVNPEVPARSLEELVAYAKANPDVINFGSAGVGQTTHLSGELLSQTAGIKLMHIPYRGNAPAITDTIGGQVQMMFSAPASVLPHIKSGALRALAVTGEARLAELPDVPTLREAGLPIDIYSWAGLFAPAKTPPEVIAKLRTEMQAALQDPKLLEFIKNTGGEPFELSDAEAKAYLAKERETWGSLIRARNIQAE